MQSNLCVCNVLNIQKASGEVDNYEGTVWEIAMNIYMLSWKLVIIRIHELLCKPFCTASIRVNPIPKKHCCCTSWCFTVDILLCQFGRHLMELSQIRFLLAKGRMKQVTQADILKLLSETLPGSFSGQVSYINKNINILTSCGYERSSSISQVVSIDWRLSDL